MRKENFLVAVRLGTGLVILSMLMGMDFIPSKLEVLDNGRTIISVYNMFTNNKLDDRDGDGLYDAWENELSQLTRPEIHLDKNESWLKNRAKHAVADFVKVAPINFLDGDNRDSALSRYIIVFHAIAWSRDYGRFCNRGFCYAHNGDVERLVMLWRVVNSSKIELDSIYTSAHENEDNDHSGVWEACIGCKTCNYVNVINGSSQTVCLNNGVQFSNNRVMIYVSEDKHAMYPSIQVCEQAKLIQIPFAPDLGEDCNGGGILPLQAYHVGEQGAPFIDDFSAHSTLATVFPGESVWNRKNFCGSLGNDGRCPASIGSKLIPPRILMHRAKLLLALSGM